MNTQEPKKKITARLPFEYIFIMIVLTGIGFFAFLFAYSLHRRNKRPKLFR